MIETQNLFLYGKHTKVNVNIQQILKQYLNITIIMDRSKKNIFGFHLKFRTKKKKNERNIFINKSILKMQASILWQ